MRRTMKSLPSSDFHFVSLAQHPNAFFPLDVTYASAAPSTAVVSVQCTSLPFFSLLLTLLPHLSHSNIRATARGSKTKLAPAVTNLINLLFDVKAMKRTLQELEIDTEKMPLGKLSTP